MRTVLAMVAALAVVVPLASAAPIDTSFPTLGPGGGLIASAVSGDTLFLAGFARWAGPLTGGGVPVSPADLAPIPGFPHVNGVVLAAASDEAGGWFIGGSFTHVGGRPRANLAHVRSDMTVDAWAPSTNGNVVALVVTPGQVCIAGPFTQVNGTPSNGFSGVSRSTGAVVMMPPMGGPTMALATDGTNVYLGGEFTTANGVARSRLAAFRLSDHLLTSWAPDANGGVYALRIANGYVYAGGSFSTILGLPRGGGAALDPMSGQPTAWDPHMGSFQSRGVRSLLPVGDRVYLGGDFTQMGGTSRLCLAAVDTSSGALTSWDPQVSMAVPSKMPPPFVAALERAGADVVAGGLFDLVGGAPRSDLVRLGAVTGVVLPGTPESPGEVDALAASSPGLFVGGQFATLGASRRGDLVAVRISTGELLPWGPDATHDTAESMFGNRFWHTSRLTAIAVDAERVYVGQTFFEPLAGFDVGDVHAYSRATGAHLWEWPAYKSVNALALHDTVLYVGGEFLDGPAGAVRALRAATGTQIPWGVAVDGAEAYALAATPAGLAVGGAFTSLGGEPRTDLAMLDWATGEATSWDPEPDGAVWSLATAGNTLFCGGEFSNVGGEPRSRIASLALDTGTPETWNPGANATVRGLTFDQGVLFAGGDFTAVGGQPRSSFAALSPATGAVWPLDPAIGAGHTVLSISRGGGHTFVAGSQTASGVEPTLALTAVIGPDAALGVGGPGAHPGRGSLHVEPQPARTAAQVRLRLPRETDAEIGLYDISGRRLAILAPWKHQPAGDVTVSLEARSLNPGIYVVRAITPEGDIAGKLVVVP